MAVLVVGTPVPPEVAAVLEACPRRDVTGVRWTPPEEWVVTVREIGDVSAETGAAMADALRGALAGVPAADVTLGSARREAGIVIDVAGLEAQTQAVFDATAPVLPVLAGAPRQARIVLARGRVPKELVQPVPAVGWRVGELALLARRRSAEGRGFDVLEVFPLR